MTIPAGWYPDPENTAYRRRWTGTEWTDERELAPPVLLRRRGPGVLGVISIAIGIAALAFGLLGVFLQMPGSLWTGVVGGLFIAAGSMPRPPVVVDGSPRLPAWKRFVLPILFFAVVAFIIYLFVLIVGMISN
ncbi:hypothetical protein BKA24_001700 [Microbacterium marinum]|uniref:DUF2510 domain-containing protein n=1 Tax=Microbacterium marinum TaxID=421115 RepID=A0A7W7BSE9_9MICO|nr:DUF2510 domain-containing protein [Microbacterium marinum]MBB4666991.1 hypothetical protein [Microbacterium marinum]